MTAESRPIRNMEICLQTGNSRKRNLNTKAQTPASISLNISSTTSSCHRQLDRKGRDPHLQKGQPVGPTDQSSHQPGAFLHRGQGSNANRHPTAQELQDTQRPRGGSTQPTKKDIILLFPNRIPNCCELCWQSLSSRHPSILVGFHHPTPHPQARNRIFIVASLFFHFHLRPSSTTLAKPPVHHRPRSLSDGSPSHFPIDLLGG